MGVIGRQPAPAPLTAADIADGIITPAKLAQAVLPANVLRPSIVSPTYGQSGVIPSVFTTSAYYSLYGQTHTKTQWQIATDLAFTNLVVDTGDSSDLTTYSPSVPLFATSTPHWWRVRYKDASGNYSDWSDPAPFTTAGSFSYTVEYLLVAGGGNGMVSPYGGGGGGAGGVLHNAASDVTIGTAYTVTVGAGGGNHTTFKGGQAFGGGFGSSGSGGSGGGGGHSGASYQYGVSNQTSNAGGVGYGNNGGTNYYGGSYPCGSGGGAGGAGGQMSSGGVGRQFSVSGSSVYYAGGGGAADYNGNGTGGGAGGGGSAHGGVGGANTGGGGGGGKNGGSGTGGSGVCIIRYAGAQRGTGGNVTSVGGYTIHTFTSSGTFTA